MTASLLAAWGVQALLIAAILAATAAVLQWIARDAVPARAIWALALLGATLLTFVSPLRLWRTSAAGREVVVQGMPLSGAALEATARFSPAAWTAAATARIRRTLEAPTTLAADAARGIPPVGARVALIVWGLASGAILLLLFASHRRLGRALGAAPAHEIDGVPVRLTRDLGPAVVGVRAPIVAVPAWLLTLPAEEQALVVRHERSHVAAGDPLLLMCGVALAALQPWNPFAWLLVSRLRLAIELDCDRRLLRDGTSKRAYGDLLIALAAATTPAHRPAMLHPMFSPHTSHLAQRIIAMTERPVRLITARRLAVAALGAVAFVAACESRLPTDAEVASMDATMVERRVAGVVMLDTGSVRYFVDGKPSTEAIAKAVVPEDIASVEVVKGDSPVIRILTRAGAATSAAPSGVVERRVEGMPFVVVRDSSDTGGAPRVLMRGRPLEVETAKEAFTGLLIVDGIRADQSSLKEIPSDRIQSVTVFKGAQAVALYGPDGAKGVIVIKTKPRE